MLPRLLPIALAAAGVYALLLFATGTVDVARSSDAAVSDGLVPAAVDVPIAVASTEPPPAAPDPPQTSEEPAAVATPSPEPPPLEVDEIGRAHV